MYKYSAVFLLLFVLFTTGCASNTELFEIQYGFEDDPAGERIVLTYKNNLDKPVCLLPEMWPNSAGAISTNRVVLRIGGEQYGVEESNTGYCPEGCAIKVEPNQEIESFFLYKDFGLPIELYGDEKALDFHPKVFFCK